MPLYEKRNSIFWQNLTHINTGEYESEIDVSEAGLGIEIGRHAAPRRPTHQTPYLWPLGTHPNYRLLLAKVFGRANFNFIKCYTCDTKKFGPLDSFQSWQKSKIGRFLRILMFAVFGYRVLLGPQSQYLKLNELRLRESRI
jgi:hypothetical protein